MFLSQQDEAGVSSAVPLSGEAMRIVGGEKL